MRNWNKRNPFLNNMKGSSSMQSKTGSSPFQNTVSTDPKTQEYRMLQAENAPNVVNLSDVRQMPRHLFVPEGAQSVWIAKAYSIPDGTIGFDLMTFVAPKGAKTFFLGYGIFCDALLFNSVEYIPTVNGSRVFPFHGDPDNNFKIALGRTTDLGQDSMIPCQLALNPNDILKWKVSNTSGVDVVMAVGMIGYVDTTNTLTNSRFGG